MPLKALLANPAYARLDKVELVYRNLQPDDQAAFRELIADEVTYGHQVIATQLQAMGYMVDRKQIHAFREKLKMGRVSLELDRPAEQ